MTVTYSRVGIELWGSKTIGECTPRQVENVRSKRRVSAGRDLVCSLALVATNEHLVLADHQIWE